MTYKYIYIYHELITCYLNNYVSNDAFYRIRKVSNNIGFGGDLKEK